MARPSSSRHAKLVDRILNRPGRLDPEGSLRTAVVLVSLLVLAVPAVALATGISLLLLVPLAGLAYFAYLLSTNRLVVGFGSAFFVLLTFNANVPIVHTRGIEHAEIYMFDLLLVPMGILGLYWYRQSEKRIPKLGRTAIAALALFAVWSVLAAIVGNGPSQLAALVFSLEQVKFAVVLFTAALYVFHTDARCALYPLLVAVAGHVAFAFAQAVNGSIFGLSYLGETSSEAIGRIAIGPVVYQAGQHTGGFVGSSRVLVGLLLLFTPIFVVQFLASKRDAVVGVVGASVAGLLVLMSDTDAGWAAFVTTMLVAATIFAARYYWRPSVSFGRASAVTAAAAVIVVVLREWDRVTGLLGWAVAMIFGLVPLTEGGGGTPSGGSTGGGGTPSGGSTGGGGTPSGGSVTATPSDPPVSRSGVVDTSTLGIRLDQYFAALDIARRHPLFGIGGSNFNLIAPTFGIPAEMSIHNIFLAYLAATGIPGLLCFLTAVSAVALDSVQQALGARGDRQLLALGLLAGLGAYLAFAFWTTMHNSTPAMATFWSVCGIGIGTSAGGHDS